jgi:CheY-like chemotaxis protein
MKDGAFVGASILLVEDDPDIRDLMSTLLTMAGFEPTVCSNAEFGLEQLREQPFDLVLTDYALPNRNGAWLLQQAKAEGLLEATPAMIVTAHPNPPDVQDYEVICKPFDLDDLIARVKQRLDGTRRRATARPVAAGSKRPGDNNGGDCPDPVELILYVSRFSPKSAAAVANIKHVLERFKSPRIRLTIYDLADTPTAGNADSVAFTPTLVKRSPGPRTFIIGHITNPDILVELLESCGEEAR